MTVTAAALLAPLSNQSADELGPLIDDAVDAGRQVGTVVTDALDLASSKATATEWVSLGQDVALVVPPALKAVEALAWAFGLDEAFKTWLARAPERRAAREARRAERRRDTDGDGVPDRRDRDDDNDGVPDRVDVAPKDPRVATVEDLGAR